MSQWLMLQWNYCLSNRKSLSLTPKAMRGSVCGLCKLRTKARDLILETDFQDLSLWSLTRWNVHTLVFQPSILPTSSGCLGDWKYLSWFEIYFKVWVRRISTELCYSHWLKNLTLTIYTLYQTSPISQKDY